MTEGIDYIFLENALQCACKTGHRLLFQSLIRKNMNCNSDSKKDEESSESPMFSHEYCAVEQSDPHHADRNDLYPQRYRPMNRKIGNICSELRMIHQPFIPMSVSPQKQSSRKQKKRSSWQHRKKHSKCRKT